MAHELLIKYGVIINGTQSITGVTTDSGLTSNSDYVLSTQKAVKSYVDSKVNQSTSGLSYTLSGLTDVALSSPASGEVLQFNGIKWTDHMLVKADISGFTESDYVHVTGNENVGGTKTFTSNINVDGVNTQLGVASIDVLNRRLTNTGAVSTLDWQTLALYDASNNTAVTWASRLLIDSANKTSVDWNNRYLVDNTGANVIDWQNKVFAGSGQWRFSTAVLITGNLTVSGTTTYLNTQNLNVANNYIYINSGETGTGVTAGVAGIVVKRGTSADYLIEWSEVQQNFRVGSTGQTQALAAREDTPNNGYIATWDAATYKFVTTLNPATLATISYVGANFLSANTSFYTQAQADANFLSANTSFYTQAQADANFLSANTSFYTQAQANANFLSANTSFYTQQQANSNFLSANTSFYTQSQANANFLSANTSFYTEAQANANFLSANTSFYTQAQADANFLSASTNITKGTATGTNVNGIGGTFVNTLGTGVVYHYSIVNGVSGRTGTINAFYNTSSGGIEWNDTSTPPIGVVDCELNVTNNGSVISLNSTATGSWTINVTRIILG